MTPARAFALLVTAAVVLGSCGARTGLDVAADADAPAPDAHDATPADAAACSCRVCRGRCVNVPGCPGGLCRGGRCFPLCANDGSCAAGGACATVLDCDVAERVCR